ncbi:hypothetical protein [Pleurocapsa sp. FMAR1]|uniref:hypothetical protein n=1 Tax=Pleurocapsa sp. FMAR1 TaxID=3040204 RepID=UPI0029C686D8|nr:hypothetical protein [Pleurocapsa sp. FMAR1]
MNESNNSVMSMAQFIFSHPELQMLTPRVWQTHYEDECKSENKICSFSSLRRYPCLVRIEKAGRYNLYGSAKIPASTMTMVNNNVTKSS